MQAFFSILLSSFRMTEPHDEVEKLAFSGAIFRRLLLLWRIFMIGTWYILA